MTHFRGAVLAANRMEPPPASIHIIAPEKWVFSTGEFDISVDVGRVLTEHGPGVYTVALRAHVDGEDMPISEYFIFHEVEIPEGDR